MTQESACLLRAIRGPVMMITIGALFALDSFTPFGFSRTWPILLVVIGILNLGQPRRLRGRMRYQAQWGPPHPPGPTPPPSPPPSGASKPETAPPGSYRGSPYEATPGGSGTRGTEPKLNREKPSATGPGATP